MQQARRQFWASLYVILLLWPCLEVLSRGEFFLHPLVVGPLSVGPAVVASADARKTAMYNVDETCVNNMVASDKDALARLHNLARFYTAVYVSADTEPPTQRLGMYLLHRLFIDMYPSADAYIGDIKAVAAFLVRVMGACATRVDNQPTGQVGVAISVSHPGISLNLGHGRRLEKWPNWLFEKVPGPKYDWDPLTVGLGIAIGVAVGAAAVVVAPVAAPVVSAAMVALGVAEGVAGVAAPIVTGLGMAKWASYVIEKLDEDATKILNLPEDRKKQLEIATKAGVLLTDVVDFASNAAEESWEGLELGRRIWNPNSKNPEGLSSVVNNIINAGKGRKSIIRSTKYDTPVIELTAPLATDLTALRVTVGDAKELFDAARGNDEGNKGEPSSEGRGPASTLTPRSSSGGTLPSGRCSDVAGQYPMSADNWSPAAQSQPCPKLVRLDILPDCKVVITDETGAQLTTAKYTPGSPNPWQGKLEFSADWLGKGGRAWSTENAAAPRSLGLPCDNTKTGEVLGTWSYSMPSFGNRGTTAGGKPQGGSQQKSGGGDWEKSKSRFESVCSKSDCEACKRGASSCAKDTCCCPGHCGF